MLVKLKDQSINGYIYKIFDEISLGYPEIVMFYDDKDDISLGFKEESDGTNIEYCKRLDLYYFPVSFTDFRVRVDEHKYNLKRKPLYLKRITVKYNDKLESFLLPINIDCYILNNNGDTMQKI